MWGGRSPVPGCLGIFSENRKSKRTAVGFYLWQASCPWAFTGNHARPNPARMPCSLTIMSSCHCAHDFHRGPAVEKHSEKNKRQNLCKHHFLAPYAPHAWSALLINDVLFTTPCVLRLLTKEHPGKTSASTIIPAQSLARTFSCLRTEHSHSAALTTCLLCQNQTSHHASSRLCLRCCLTSLPVCGTTAHSSVLNCPNV